MRIWFDTEFIEDGMTIDLLSIGMIRDDGATYYAEFAGVDLSKADRWVRENVLPHMTGVVTERTEIAQQIVAFAGPNPEFWAYYADYDWVAICQLFGRMVDLPEGWPMYCRDVKQLCDAKGSPLLPKHDGTEHNALDDALWTRKAWQFLTSDGDNA